MGECPSCKTICPRRIRRILYTAKASIFVYFRNALSANALWDWTRAYGSEKRVKGVPVRSVSLRKSSALAAALLANLTQHKEQVSDQNKLDVITL